MIVFNNDSGAVLHVQQDNPPIVQIAADSTLTINTNISATAVFGNPYGLYTAVTFDVWDCNIPTGATVTAIKAKRTGGTGATINVRKLGGSTVLASNFSITSTSGWLDAGTLQNTSFAFGDGLQAMLVSVSGAPTQVSIQIEFTTTI